MKETLDSSRQPKELPGQWIISQTSGQHHLKVKLYVPFHPLAPVLAVLTSGICILK